MEFTLSKNWCKGLGTELTVLCTLLDYNVRQLNINSQLNNKNFERYKQIFKISDDQLVINQTTNLTNEIDPSDLFKVFSPYYKLPSLKTGKRYIGIAAYQDGMAIKQPSLQYPECKVYPITQYAELFKFLKSCGWEIITLDSRSISLEEKVYLISNMCECVIGYEGGIAHLCHMLDVPYIMLPWRIPFDVKLMHLDEKTFFLDSFDQMLQWNKQDLDKCISDLNNRITNNELLNNKDLILQQWGKHPISINEKRFLESK